MIVRLLEKDMSVELVDNGKEILNEKDEAAETAPAAEPDDNPFGIKKDSFGDDEDYSVEDELKLDKNNKINDYLLTVVPKKHGRPCTKFRATNNKKTVDGHTLYQIIGIDEAHNGELGGYIENGWNLGPFGESWVDASSCIYGNAVVWGDSQVVNGSTVYGTYQVRTVINGKGTVINDSEVFGLMIHNSFDEGSLEGEDEVNTTTTVTVTKSTIKSISTVVNTNTLTIDHSTVDGYVQFGDSGIVGNIAVTKSTLAGTAKLYGTVVVDNATVRGDATVYNAAVKDGATVEGQAKVYTTPDDWSSDRKTVISGSGVILKGARNYTNSVSGVEEVPSEHPSYATLNKDGDRINPFQGGTKAYKRTQNGEYIYWKPGRLVLPRSQEEYDELKAKKGRDSVRIFKGDKWNTKKEFELLKKQGRAHVVENGMEIADGTWGSFKARQKDDKRTPKEFQGDEFKDENGNLDTKAVLDYLAKEGRLVEEPQHYVHTAEWYKQHPDDWKELKKKYLWTSGN